MRSGTPTPSPGSSSLAKTMAWQNADCPEPGAAWNRLEGVSCIQSSKNPAPAI